MPRYLVTHTRTVRFLALVDAENETDAADKIRRGIWAECHEVESDTPTVDKVEPAEGEGWFW